MVILVKMVEETWQEVAVFSPSRGQIEKEKLSRKQPDLYCLFEGINDFYENGDDVLAISDNNYKLKFP